MPAWPTASPRCCVIINRQPNANIIETVDRVTATAAVAARVDPERDHRSTLGDGAHGDDSRVAARRRGVRWRISIVLVMLVVFLFLRDGRATLIPSVAVPVSLDRYLRRHVPVPASRSTTSR